MTGLMSDVVTTFIGAAPEGYEYLQYLFEGVLGVFMVISIAYLFFFIAGLLSGR